MDPVDARITAVQYDRLSIHDHFEWPELFLNGFHPIRFDLLPDSKPKNAG